MNKGNCHTGNPLVFETSDGIRIYAGGNTRKGGWMQMKPRPDLAIGPQGVIRTARKFDVIPDGFTCVNHVQAIDTPHIIELEWPDFSIPSNVGREFWVSLVADVKAKGIKSISCQCMGGHGRTGVQLAIFAHLMIEKKNQTWKDAGELIQWVRDSYCTHAVEAQSQQEYIATVCQIPYGEDKVQTLSSSASVFDWSSPSKAFDPDELKFELERDSKKKSKKKQVGKNYFTSNKGKPKTIPKTHITGYALYWCDNCGQYEFRTNKVSDGKLPCIICDSKDMMYELGEMTLDNENYEDYCEVKCEETGEMFHPLETYKDISKLHLIKLNKCGSNSKNLRIKNGGKRWQDRRYKCDMSGRVTPLVFLHFEKNIVCSKEVMILSDEESYTFDDYAERNKDVGLDKGSLDDWI